MKMIRGRLLALAVAGFLAATHGAAEARDLTVFAAASMKNALDAINVDYSAAEGDKVVVSYAASSALAKQMEAGAPADLFVSADQDWMNYAQERGLIDPATRQDLLKNRIVLIAPADSKIGETAIEPGFKLAELLDGGRLAMGNVDAVPAGKYGKAALESLGVWGEVSDRVAQSENVRAALLLVSRGEAALGIVYQTDAAPDQGVKIVGTFPEDTHEPIIYPVAATKDGAEATKAYRAFLTSGKARAAFEAQGFQVLD